MNEEPFPRRKFVLWHEVKGFRWHVEGWHLFIAFLFFCVCEQPMEHFCGEHCTRDKPADINLTFNGPLISSQRWNYRRCLIVKSFNPRG